MMLTWPCLHVMPNQEQGVVVCSQSWLFVQFIPFAALYKATSASHSWLGISVTSSQENARVGGVLSDTGEAAGAASAFVVKIRSRERPARSGVGLRMIPLWVVWMGP